MKCSNVCLHTNDKKYTIIENPQFSAVDIPSHKTKPNLNALNGQVWDENEILYWQLDSKYEFLDVKIQEDLIKDALLETSLTTKLKIQQKRRQSGDAQIIVNWLGKKDESFFKTLGVLAFGFGPGSGLGGNVSFNSDNIWRLPEMGPLTVKEAFDLGMIQDYDRNNPDNEVRTFDPYHTGKHELGGHACGMNHITEVSRQFDTVMYPFYNGLRMFGKYDLESLFKLYTKIGSWERAIRIAKLKMGFKI